MSGKLENELRVIMVKKKISIGDLEVMTGISRQTISKLYKEEEGNMKFSRIITIMQALDCSFYELFPGLQKQK